MLTYHAEWLRFVVFLHLRLHPSVSPPDRRSIPMEQNMAESPQVTQLKVLLLKLSQGQPASRLERQG